jgi:hypothetical protein
MAKRRARSQIINLTFDNWKLGVAPILLFVGGVTHTVEKLSMRAINLLQTSLQLEVCTQNYGPPKSQESQFWEFWDSHLGVLGQNDIWVLALWPYTKITIRGRWWLPPSPGCGEFCEFVVTRGLSMHQRCSNYALINLLFGLCNPM